MESSTLAGAIGEQPLIQEARAGFWRRFLGAFIDGVILAIVGGILVVVFHFVGDLLGIAVGLAYFTYFEGSTGQTWGKGVADVRVVDKYTGDPIGYGRAAGRWFARILSAIVFYLGYLWMLWDKENQCWHDKLVGDLVIVDHT